ncbi:MAG: T9SS type A sorting domain-containing protein [Saprospiraceae bacterium]|nr:T9SS type A sorting domain-containing protein [Candidatus Defluviibacterium haderslevense]
MRHSIISIFLLLISSLLYSQRQIGLDINGESQDEFLGTSVAISDDGSTFVMGMNPTYSILNPQGYIKVFKTIGQSNHQLGNTIYGNGLNIHFGGQVSISGDGNRITTVEDFASGIKVFVFDLVNNNWIKSAEIISTTRIHEAYLSGDGKSLVISKSMSITTYKEENNNWIESGNIMKEDLSSELFSYRSAISFDGKILVFSDPDYNNINDSHAGKVYFYEYLNNEWKPNGIPIIGISAWYRMGIGIDISKDGKRVAILTQATTSGTNYGTIIVLDHNVNDWIKTSEIKGEINETTFGGLRLSLSGNGKVIVTSSSNGLVHFEEINNNWKRIGNYINSHIHSDGHNEDLGYSLDLNYEGLRYVVGGIGSISKSTSRGTVRVFQFDQIMGNVILDENYTCKYDAYNELFVGGVTLLIQPGDIKVTTDSNGYWSANSLTNGTYIISLDTSHYSDCKRLDTFQIVDEIKFLNLPTQYLQREKKNKIIGRFFLDDQFPFCSQNTSELPAAGIELLFSYKTGSIKTVSDSNGFFIIKNPPIGFYQIKAVDSLQYGICGSGSFFNYYQKDTVLDLKNKPISKKQYKSNGKLYHDRNYNNNKDLNENFANNVKFKIGNIVGITDSTGSWEIIGLKAGNYTIEIDTSKFLQCKAQINISSPEFVNSFGNIGIQIINNCIDPIIDIFMPRMRPCTDGQELKIKVNNPPYSIANTDSLLIKINLPEYIVPTLLPKEFRYNINQDYYFKTKPIKIGQSETFSILNRVKCETPLGITLCMEGQILNLDSCSLVNYINLYNPLKCNPIWDSAHLMVTAICEFDSIFFNILNNGKGDLDCYSPVNIFEDQQLILKDSVKLRKGEHRKYAIPSEKSFYRIEVAQSEFHPGNSRPNANIETCTTMIPSKIGLRLKYYEDDLDHYKDIFCGIVKGSYDPNDKSASPSGIGNLNYIRPEEMVSYVIRFQNTGNDTAYKVVIRDTISELFDILKLEIGPSSHNHSFKLFGKNILEWTFSNINLVDSTTNEKLSHGYIQFKVPFNKLYPNHTTVTNSASIYFDDNPPILTNQISQTIHQQLEEHTTDTKIVEANKTTIRLFSISPNPTNGIFEIKSLNKINHISILKIFNLEGMEIYNDFVKDQKIIHIFNNGVYIIKIINNDGQIQISKVVVQ